MAPRFKGKRRWDGRVQVVIDDREANRYEPLKNISPSGSSGGFEYGYLESELTALAASMCIAVSVGSPVGPGVIDFVQREHLQDLAPEWEIPFSAIVDSMARASGIAGHFEPGAE